MRCTCAPVSLPGLIIKVEDAEGDYSFDLEQSKKIEKPAEFQSWGNTVKVKRKDFKTQMAKFEKDPMSVMSGQGFGNRGNNRQDPQRMKAMQTRMKEEMANNNNPIERD